MVMKSVFFRFYCTVSCNKDLSGQDHLEVATFFMTHLPITGQSLNNAQIV